MRRSRRSRGGGYSVSPSDYVSVGNPVYQQYSGVGKDCVADSFVRPGFLSMFPGHAGVPGMAGGKRKNSKKRSMRRRQSRNKRRSMRGGTRLAVASFENPVGEMLAAHAVPKVSAPGVEAHDVQDVPSAPQAVPVPKQMGGRYESRLGASLDSVSAIGMSSYAPIQSIKCEGGFANSLNTGTGMLQRPMLGGAMLANPIELRMPTGGYSHQFETYGGTSAVGGLMLNIPYDARASNPACGHTGGKRSKRNTKRSKRSKRNTKRNHKNRK